MKRKRQLLPRISPNTEALLCNPAVCSVFYLRMQVWCSHFNISVTYHLHVGGNYVLFIMLHTLQHKDKWRCRAALRKRRRAWELSRLHFSASTLNYFLTLTTTVSISSQQRCRWAIILWPWFDYLVQQILNFIQISFSNNSFPHLGLQQTIIKVYCPVWLY